MLHKRPSSAPACTRQFVHCIFSPVLDNTGLLHRSAAFANLGIPGEATDSTTPLVTMLKKKGKRIIENADEIMAHLKGAFPWARFNTLDGEAVAVMSIKEQVMVLSVHPASKVQSCRCVATQVHAVCQSSTACKCRCAGVATANSGACAADPKAWGGLIALAQQIGLLSSKLAELQAIT